MLSDSRSKFIKIAGLVALASAAWALFSVLTLHSEALENEASYRSDIHRENANYRIIWVCKSAPSQQTCIDETRQAARENEREEQDLAAQKITAWWTKVMGIAALIGMGLSAVGVWLVKTTFDETRKANLIANEALDGQLRPWLSFTVQLGSIRCNDNTLKTQSFLEIENHGPSPSIYTSYTAALYVEHMPSERIFYLLPSLFEETSTGHGRTIFSSRSWGPECETVAENAPTGPHAITLVLAVRYRSAYSARQRYTCRIYDYITPRREDGLIDIPEEQDHTILRGSFHLRHEAGELST